MAEPAPGRFKLRPIEAVPVNHEGRRALMLRDPLRLSEEVLLVPMPLVPVLQRLDGRHGFEAIREECAALHGARLSEEDFRAVVSRLEEARFLEGESFASWSASLKDAFLRAPSRPAFLAGESYEADPARLRARMDGFFAAEDGPGMPSANRAAPAAPLRGVIAPHIDFQRGGSVFAWAYRAVAERADADLFVVLGTAHAPTRGLWSLTRKSFETPLGTLETDAEFVDALSRRLGADAFRDEFVHRAEHALEFQAVFLQYLFAGARRVRFAPVLVGSFGAFVARGESPRGDAEVEGFIAALKEAMAEREREGRRVCLMASADLAHVGPRFGDEAPVDAARLEALARADAESLEAARRGDAEAFYWSVAEDGDARRVCGLAPVYAMLRALDGCEGETLRYAQWPDPNGTVTFCAAAFA